MHTMDLMRDDPLMPRRQPRRPSRRPRTGAGRPGGQLAAAGRRRRPPAAQAERRNQGSQARPVQVRVCAGAHQRRPPRRPVPVQGAPAPERRSGRRQPGQRSVLAAVGAARLPRRRRRRPGAFLHRHAQRRLAKQHRDRAEGQDRRDPAANVVGTRQIAVGQLLARHVERPGVSAAGRPGAQGQPGLARRRPHRPPRLAGRAGRRRHPQRRRPDRLHAADRPAVVHRQPVVRRAGTEPRRRRHFAGRTAGAGGAGAGADRQRQETRLAVAAGARPAAADAAAAAADPAPARRRQAAPPPAARLGPAGRRRPAALARLGGAVLRLRRRARLVRPGPARGAPGRRRHRSDRRATPPPKRPRWPR